MREFKLNADMVTAMKAVCEKHGLQIDGWEKGDFVDEVVFPGEGRQHCEVEVFNATFPERDGVVHDLMIEATQDGGMDFVHLAIRRDGEPDQDTDIVWQDGCDDPAEALVMLEDWIQGVCNPPVN
jgi:hypothetical protein